MENIYEAVIGLEIHLQLKTKTKAFCKCSANYNNSSPNTHLCPICLGHPGALPKLNREVLDLAIIGGLALNCDIEKYSRFDRKNYFYPDLVKSYQITQFEYPFALNGFLMIDNKKIRIRQIHIEEDTGKMIHNDKINETYINYNRSSIPLIEIVTKPDISSSKEAYNFLTTLKSTLKYTKISDVNMENGSLRCDANVSVKKIGDKILGTRTETKNLNSFKAVSKSIDYEISRQIELLESGKKVELETRLWDENLAITRTLRSKENLQDYRYFTEPDLPAVIITNEDIERLKKRLPEFQNSKQKRFESQYKISEYDANLLSSNVELANYFEESVKFSNSPKLTSNWILTEVLKVLKYNRIEIQDFKVSAQNFGKLILNIENKIISGKIAKIVFEKMCKNFEDPNIIIKKEGLVQITDNSELEKIVDGVIDINQQSVTDFQNGKDRAFKFLMGQVMKETKGKADPKRVSDILKDKI